MITSQLAAPPSSSVGGEGAQALSFSTLQILTVVINIPPLDGSNMRFELKKQELLRIRVELKALFPPFILSRQKQVSRDVGNPDLR